MKMKKNKLANLLKTGILLFGISLLLWNCENEESLQNLEVLQKSPLDYVKLEKTSYNSISLQSNLSKSSANKNNDSDLLSWAANNNYYFNPSNFIKAIDSIGNETYTTSLHIQDTPNNVFYNLVIPKKLENNFVSNPLIIKYELAEGTKKDFKISTQNPFVGTISVFNLSNFKNSSIKAKGATLDANPCMKNKVTKYSNSNGNGNSSSSGGGGANIDNTNSGDPANNYGINIGVRSFFFSSGGGGGGRSRSQLVDWGVGVFNFPDIANVNYSKSASNNTITCPDGRIVTVLVTDEYCSNGKFVNGVCVEEDKIITDNLNNPCVVNILKELQKKDTKNAIVPDLTGVSHLSQTILDLFDTSTNDNLTFEIKQLGSTSAGERNAQTTNVTGGWKITLDTDLVKNGTQLFMAKTLIHESMHAFIKYNLKTNRTSNLATDLNALYQKFKSQNNSSNLTHHEFMSQYVEALSYSLAAYDNHQQPNVYYKMLSWGGLETSTVYQALSNKTEIQNAINNERYGKSNAKGKKCD
jgi:hypothetical protein